MKTETKRKNADKGRSKKIIKLPSDNISDLLREVSSIGPKTKARTKGAAS